MKNESVLIESARTDLSPPTDLIGRFLEEQQSLSAVDTFSRWHEQGDGPHRHGHYRSLMPAAKPVSGEQYAFEVDLDKCSGCKACVTACHSLNGLSEAETWRSVGELQGGTAQDPFKQVVTAACHHCAEPACMLGCPVQAFEKDPETGIVKHLDDQCFGCQYCTLKCPYDVPQYNEDLGIVRKCDMCSDRLAIGEAPACVQACPSNAIRIVTVKTDDVRAPFEPGACESTRTFLETAPDPAYTLPTTRYVTKAAYPRNTRPADYAHLKPESAHGALIVMLVFHQASVGLFSASLFSAMVGADLLGLAQNAFWYALALALNTFGLAASVAHLGRPHLAFRAFLGWRTSWLSREVIALGAYAVVAAILVGFHCFPQSASGLLDLMGLPETVFDTLMTIGLTVTVVLGWIGIFCSIMVYVDTRRPFWRADLTAPRFALTALVLGLGFVMLAGAVTSAQGNLPETPAGLIVAFRICCAVLIAATLSKMGFEASFTRKHLDAYGYEWPALRKSAVLLKEHLALAYARRFALGLLGGVVIPGLLLIQTLVEPSARWGEGVLAGLAILAVVFLFGGEIGERYLFFRAVVKPKMPGGPA